MKPCISRGVSRIFGRTLNDGRADLSPNEMWMTQSWRLRPQLVFSTFDGVTFNIIINSMLPFWLLNFLIHINFLTKHATQLIVVKTY